MATENERLVTEAKLKTSTPGIIEDSTTGRRALTFPTGTSEVGDTGWVDVRAGILNGWTATELKIRRQGNTTRVRFKNLNNSAATSQYFYSLPNGYGGNERYYVPVAIKSEVRAMYVSYRGLSFPIDYDTDTGNVVELVIPVEGDAWPVTLGGDKL